MSKIKMPRTFMDALSPRSDGCPFCDEPGHHKPLFTPPPDAPAALHDPDVQDGQVHALTEAWVVLKKYGVPEDEWLDVLAPLATAIGWVGAACEHFGRRGALEAFWAAVIEEQGEGTYVFDVSRIPGVSGRVQ